MQQQSEFPETGFVRLASVLRYLPISKTRFYAGIKNGEFPAPVHLGRLSLWRASDIRDAIQKIGNGASSNGR